MHATRGKIPTKFIELNRALPLRPIRDDEALEVASEMADRLAVLDRRTKDQDDYLEALATLIEKYEEEQHDIDTSDLDPVDTLKYLMEENGMRPSDLESILGHRSIGYAILNRTRGISAANIGALAKHFGVGPDVFLKMD